jgi:hypothetical protein
MSVAPLPGLHALDATALRDIVVQQQAQIFSRDAELECLRLVIARLQRIQFGRKSEKIERQIEQLELQLGFGSRHGSGTAADREHIAASGGCDLCSWET